MDKIQKFLQQLSGKELARVLVIMLAIQSGEWTALDMKKLMHEEDLYRVRTGKIRIVFRMVNGKWVVVNIDYRGDVYKNL